MDREPWYEFHMWEVRVAFRASCDAARSRACVWEADFGASSPPAQREGVMLEERLDPSSALHFTYV